MLERFTSDGLCTRDLGFVLDGEVFVIGRVDDVLSVAGRTIYARDIEAALTVVEGIRPGACAVIDVVGSRDRHVAVLAELAESHPDVRDIAAQIRRVARSVAGVDIAGCRFLPRGSLPKTPSGKLQRFRCRELFADEFAVPS